MGGHVRMVATAKLGGELPRGLEVPHLPAGCIQGRLERRLGVPCLVQRASEGVMPSHTGSVIHNGRAL